MRSLLFIFFLLNFINWQSINAQQIKDEQKQENSDSAIVRVLYSFTQRNSEDISKLKTDTMALDIGSRWSKYYDPSIQLKDSIRDSKMQEIKSISVIKDNPEALNDRLGANRLNETVIKSDAGISYNIYKNRPKNEIHTLDKNSAGVSVLLTENIQFQNWSFNPDTCRVLGYLCQKAEGSFRGREYDIFFTQEIPLNDGPFKFYDLPGLVMKVVSKDGLFTFKAIGLQSISENIYFNIDKNIETSRNLKQYLDFLKSKSKDAFVGFINDGNAVIYQSDPNKGFETIEIKEE